MEYEKKLSDLGKVYDKPISAMFEIIDAFSSSYIDKTFSGRSTDFNIKENKISPAAEISKVFHEKFTKELDKIVPLDDYDENSIACLLRSKTVSIN